LDDRIQELKNQSSCWIQREAHKSPVDLRAGLDQLDFQQGVLQFRFRVDGQGGPGPRDVLHYLGLSDLQTSGSTLTRTKVEIEGQTEQL
jgi:hypothetical protein